MNARPNNSTPNVIAPDLLIAAYSTGYFPMADARDGGIHWFSPDPRTIIPLEPFKISRSLRQTLKKRIFRIRVNDAFETVIRACAERPETWISEDIIRSYLQLHRLGFAHSVEAWQEERLVGGLYGVSLGGAFFGESMFSRVTDASKVALVQLVGRMRERGYVLLDTQFLTPHLEHFGAREIARSEYLSLLKDAIQLHCSFAGENDGE